MAKRKKRSRQKTGVAKSQKINQKKNKILKANEKQAGELAVRVAVPFVVAIFVSACLLFMVQPMVAKMVLPMLGGSPSVWTTCVVFFQTLLLGGYLYAHLSSQKLTLKRQMLLHAALLLVSAFCVPFATSNFAGWTSGIHPVISVLLLLTLTVGLPFFTLSASAPLLQYWFAKSGHPNAHNPYFLYVASNIGSLLVLVSYPTIMEPTTGLITQNYLWATGLAVLIGAIAACTFMVRKSRHFLKKESDAIKEAGIEEVEVIEKDESPAPSALQKLKWVGLAFIPSSLMLGLTTYFTTDIATIPLFWTLPLAIYLLSFIIVFAEWQEIAQRVVQMITPIAIMLLLYSIISHAYFHVVIGFFFHLAVLFLVSLTCHGRLARTKPDAKHLTHFFLWMSFGGMLGGIFNGILAPLLFNTAVEYRLVLVLPCLLLNFKWAYRFFKNQKVTWILDFTLPAVTTAFIFYLVKVWPQNPTGLDTINGFFGAKGYELLFTVAYVGSMLICGVLMISGRPLRLTLSMIGLVYVTMYFSPSSSQVIYRDRSFFGILKVSEDPYGHFRSLMNGTTLHGQQALDPRFSREPLTYYHKQGPVGSIFRQYGGQDHEPKNIGVVGLGTGTLTTYGKPGQTMHVYEIDEHVVHIAENYFTYLSQAQADTKIIVGDARLKLQEADPHFYDILLVDAFSSDAIPVHMLTKEAVELYFDKVKPDGVVAIHTSNRYLQLEPVLGKLAQEAGLTARVNHDMSDDAAGKSASSWVILTKKEDDLRDLASSNAWKPVQGASFTPLWTDNFTSLFSVLR